MSRAYVDLVVPRKTKAPPFSVESGNARQKRPNRIWFDRERAQARNEMRRVYPLHYYISSYDTYAFLASLRQGADPAKRDASGRTPLDLAVQMAVELIETSLCTSFPIDNVDPTPAATLKPAIGSPPETTAETFANPFRAKYHDANANMYVQHNSMRYRSAGTDVYKSCREPPFLLPPDGKDGAERTYQVAAFPPQESRVDGECEDLFRDQRARRPQSPPFPLPRGDVSRYYAASHNLRPQQFRYAYDANGKPTSWSRLQREQVQLEQEHLQGEFLVAVEQFLERPPSKAAMAQMRELIRRLNVMLIIIKKFEHCLPLKREAAEKAKAYIGTALTYPYLYTASMYEAFKRYPRTPAGQVGLDEAVERGKGKQGATQNVALSFNSGARLNKLLKAWDPLNPDDGRRLVLIIMSLKMRGHELFSFMGTVSRLFNALLDQLGIFDDRSRAGGHWWKLGSECSQFYLHMAFSLDESHLFQKFITQQQLFDKQDLFKWEDLLYTLMQHRDKFRPYFAALLARRLKARVQKRLMGSTDQQAYLPETVKYPCEERYFTRQLLGEYSEIFGEAEAEEFNSMLRHWRYGAARQAPGAAADEDNLLPPPLPPLFESPAADFWSLRD
ncbi:hypothetical protein NCLIV_039410 [Neospora caninum Liverpool]|uniref:Uncharacterized protein n=1 Tax=Neospora caninum (strain Liverpool) TaxID=572307 RepID=F0VB44_NEOCL|nr:hypothetical protein NCLIV_039410 [Neospora caninum Liverpool]CBZ50866.1 hypothetical protein NCLIV_039410 [Neospora caninum Liverpool]CEL68168.1 TPA: hypothetical protein BN1204_039410 [Neospora caninum Liverpool]|eukprot:XP_003880899.1 hypothetical protein NCLIV_039410 [Neospora caninum Liverpool]